MRIAGIIFLLALTACGSSDDDDSFICSPSDRSGTYFADFETVDGNCPDQNSALIRLDGSLEVAPGCTVLAPPTWSDGECKLETSQYCAIDATLNVEATGISTQQDETGELITGLLFLTIDDGANILCSGTFRVTATRQ